MINKKISMLIYSLGLASALVISNYVPVFPHPVVFQESASSDRFHRILVGKIGDKYPIQMELNRYQDNIFGRYFYESKRDGSYLSLSGSINTAGVIKLTESTNEKETGSFNGKLTTKLIDGETAYVFSGNWTDAKSAKTLPFLLVEQRFNLGGGLKLASKNQNEETKAQKITIETQHNQLAGSNDLRAVKFNTAINEFVAKQIRDFKKENSQAGKSPQPADAPDNTLYISNTVLHADKNLISVIYTVYVYSGGAHGNSASRSFNYNLGRGEMLALSDLFTPNSNYLKVISDYCIDVIKRRDISDADWIGKGAGAKKENYLSWNIVPQGLLITFDAYQVAAYAAGPQEVVVPFSALKGIIKQDGPLAAFIK